MSKVKKQKVKKNILFMVYFKQSNIVIKQVLGNRRTSLILLMGK